MEKGHVILNHQPTKIQDNIEAKESCLDLIITNRPEKIASFQASLPCFSDHTLQMVIRKIKILKLPKNSLELEILKISTEWISSKT